MGLFSKFKKEKSTTHWQTAFQVTPQFYADKEGVPFGAIAFTETTDTILPKTPQNLYAVDGKTVTTWRLMLVSTSKDGIIGDLDYFEALKKLENKIVDENEKNVLVRGCTLKELESILK